MNSKLLMKACSISIKLNSMETDYIASVQISKYSTWLYVMNGSKNCEYIFNRHSYCEEDLHEYIKLVKNIIGANK